MSENPRTPEPFSLSWFSYHLILSAILPSAFLNSSNTPRRFISDESWTLRVRLRHADTTLTSDMSSTTISSTGKMAALKLWTRAEEASRSSAGDFEFAKIRRSRSRS